MKNFYIHIGPHKTGTKTIQYNLKTEEKKLLKKNIYIPKSCRMWGLPTHHLLALELLNRTTNKKVNTIKLLKEIKRVNSNVLISSEDLRFVINKKKKFLLFLNEIKKLKFNIVFIFCERSGLNYLKSIYFQIKKEKKINFFYLFIYLKDIYTKGYFKDKNNDLWYYDNKIFLNDFKKVFDEKFIIFKYSKENLYLNFINSFIKKPYKITHKKIYLNKSKSKFYNPIWIVTNVIISLLGKIIINKYN